MDRIIYEFKKYGLAWRVQFTRDDSTDAKGRRQWRIVATHDKSPGQADWGPLYIQPSQSTALALAKHGRHIIPPIN